MGKKGIDNFLIYLTVDSCQGRYASAIVKKYSHLKNINFLGKITKGDVFSYYSQVDALLFPSKLETWGLPLTEFKTFNKPIIAADLEYAHETIGHYDKSYFFSPTNHHELAEIIEKFIDGSLEFSQSEKKVLLPPFVVGWKQLIDTILE